MVTISGLERSLCRLALKAVGFGVQEGIRETEPESREEEEEQQHTDILDPSVLTREEANMAKGMLICIAFAANIGGTGTITGTPPNLVTVGILEKTYPGADTGVSYASWIQFAVPLMIISGRTQLQSS